jgi:triacylglycerol lipase
VRIEVSPYKTGLLRGNAYWMARLASQAYVDDKHTILNDLLNEDASFNAVHPFEEGNSQAILVEHDNYFCMAFRGTDELDDWIDNINAHTVKNLFGEFHRGFWKATDRVWDKIYQRYRELNARDPQKPLFLTGHSLGGAMAVIAASKLVHIDQPFISVYTFGQPRVMTQQTAQIFNMECKSRCFRFNNNNDLVTRAPSRLMGYSHVGTYLHISAKEDIEQELGFWLRFVDSAGGAVSALREAVRERNGIDFVEDHGMDKYLSAIQKWNFKST